MKIELPRILGDDRWACARFGVDAKTANGLQWNSDYVALVEVHDGKIQAMRGISTRSEMTWWCMPEARLFRDSA